MANTDNISAEKDVRPVDGGAAERLISILKKYRDAKRPLERRVKDNEELFMMRTAAAEGSRFQKRRPASAWLFNSIINKHADVMDNVPSCDVLPREESDRETAEILQTLIPVVLEDGAFESVYSDVGFDKLKTGTGVYGVFWDNEKNGGLGDVSVKRIDLGSIFWEKGVRSIQDSKYVFVVEYPDTDSIESDYPFLKDVPASNVFTDRFDGTMPEDKTEVIDVYYKVRKNGRSMLHFIKLARGKILFASENEEAFSERGYYDHGAYPFVFDRLFPESDSPCGFGFIDVMKDSQRQIDLVGQSVAENIRMASRVRYFARGDGCVNEEEFADWENPIVHYAGSGNPGESMIPLESPALPGVCLAFMNNKIDELKETSGNSSFQQGNTASGVTAASAIAALQEAGSKLSRDMIKGSYRAFCEIVKLIIELMRQFYTSPRVFRITSPNGYGFTSFDSGLLSDVETPFGFRRPVFDVKIRASKKDAFSRASQNELAKEFYSRGFFDPSRIDQTLLCLEMMDFEGKDALVSALKARAEAALSCPPVLQEAARLPNVSGKTKRNIVKEARERTSSFTEPR